MSKRKAPEASLSGLTFAITGTLSVPRAAFESLITENGGAVAKTVTKSVTHLVSSETGTKKCEEAEAKGVAIVDEQWVRDRIGGSATGSGDKKAAKGKAEPAAEAEAAPAKTQKKTKAAAAPAAAAVSAPAAKKSGSGKPLAGMTICITGTLSQPRAAFEKILTDNGASVAKTVTNSVTHLVSSETGTKKCQDAEAKGVAIVNEDWILAKI